MLSLASLRKGENFYDLGAGDGRILIEAVRRFGAKGTGIEVDPVRVKRLRERLQATSVKADIIEGDFMDVSLSDVDVTAFYLSESVNLRLAGKLKRELKPGARVVSLDYSLPNWKSEKEIIVTNGGLNRKLFLYKMQDL
jgi:SAM-dependent methyltransferase